MPRLTAADPDAARAKTIDDVLPGPGDPRLRVLFSGINPSGRNAHRQLPETAAEYARLHAAANDTRTPTRRT